MRSKKRRRKVRRIDLRVPGLGRLTVRTKRMSADAHKELARYITRAIQECHIEQLRMLRDGEVSKTDFLIAARANRLPSLQPSPGLRPLVDQWLASPGLRDSSRKRYWQSWNFLFANLGENARLRDVTQQWWPKFVQARSGVSTSTLNRDRAAVLAFRTWAKDSGYTLQEFAPKRLREEPVRSRILAADERKALAEKCRPDRYLFFWTLLETGMRQGEVLNLKTADVSTDLPTITVRSQPGAKSKGKERHIPISMELAETLRMQGSLQPDGRIFPKARATIQDWWRELRDKIGASGVTLHGFRATYITVGLDDGVPATEVQKLAGHSSLAMTERYYRNQSTTRAGAERIRQALGVRNAAAQEAQPEAIATNTSTTPPEPDFAQVG